MTLKMYLVQPFLPVCVKALRVHGWIPHLSPLRLHQPPTTSLFSFFHPYLCVSLFFFFFFFFGHTHSMWKFPNQGSNLHHSSNLSHRVTMPDRLPLGHQGTPHFCAFKNLLSPRNSFSSCHSEYNKALVPSFHSDH